MPKDFDWQTDDHTSWAEEPTDEQPDSWPASFVAWLKRWGRWLGLAAVLLLIVAFVIFSILNRRVEQAENATIDDVLAAHSLVRRAAREKDFDLLNAVMVTNERDWKDLQLDLLNVDLFLDRRPLSLRITQESGEAPVVTLSPDLETAEVVERIPYEVVGGSQISETVWLEHTFVYHRQAESWLLSPLPDDESFWGRWQNLDEGDYLTLIYPRRDEAIAFYLAENLGELVGRICQDDAIECPSNFKLEIRLSREQAGLQMFNEPISNIFPTENRGIYHLSFPPPTIIGRPVDAAGYEALYQGYANWLAAVMASRYTVGASFPFDRQIVETLAAWGLEPPPQPQQVVPLPQNVPSPPVPFPEQDILLACNDLGAVTLLRYNPRANSWSDELFGRQPTHLSGQLQPFGGFQMVPLPDDSGVLVNVNNFDGDEIISKIVSWQAGQEQLWLERDFMLQLLPERVQRQFDPTGQNLVLFNVIFQQTGGDQIARTAPYAFNIGDCLSGSCEAQFYDGFPFWSLDLSSVLLVDLENQSALTLRDERTGQEVSLGSGFSPFWLDSETFIYIRPLEEAPDAEGTLPTSEIVTADVGDPLSGTVLVDSAEIAAEISALLSESDPATPAGLRYVIAHPNQPEWLFLVISLDPAIESRSDIILTYQIDTGRLERILELENFSAYYPFQIIQEGQLMAVQTFAPNSPSGSLVLFPLDPEEKTVGPPIETYPINGAFNDDISQNGRWLLITGQDTIRLIAPGHNYDQSITHNLDFCSNAAWINPIN